MSKKGVSRKMTEGIRICQREKKRSQRGITGWNKEVMRGWGGFFVEGKEGMVRLSYHS